MIKKIQSSKHSISFTVGFLRIKKKNTISKLLEILEKKILKNKKFNIKIKKFIPNKAGLGGGSMNAASILKYLIKKGIIDINKKDVIEVTNSIGSDVILGLNNTNSILTSNNNIKRYNKCKKFYTLIVKPNFGCSTKQIYSNVKIFSKPKLKKPSSKMFELNYLKKMNNSLEQIVLSKYSKLRKIKSFLEGLPNIVRKNDSSGSVFVAY